MRTHFSGMGIASYSGEVLLLVRNGQFMSRANTGTNKAASEWLRRRVIVVKDGSRAEFLLGRPAQRTSMDQMGDSLTSDPAWLTRREGSCAIEIRTA
jgi:hypothetical protein